MVPLAAAPVIENARAAPGVAYSGKARRDFANRGVPIDLFEGSVGLAPKRCRQAIPPVLVKVQTLRFLACVAVRCGRGAVTSYPRDVAVFDLYFDSAIDRAQDASRLEPLVSHDASPDQSAGRARASAD